MNIKVSEIVSQFLDENNLGQAEFAKAYRIAIRGWRQLNWDILGSICIEDVELCCDMTSDLPEGTLSVLDFGLCNGNGGIRPFKGYYRVDLVNGKISVNADNCEKNFKIKIVKQEMPDGDYMINELASEALFAFIDYRWHYSNKQLSFIEKSDKKRYWLNQKALAKRRIKKIGITQLKNTVGNNLNLGVAFKETNSCRK